LARHAEIRKQGKIKMLVRVLKRERSICVDKLNGKLAVITGASSGIGEATVEALAVEGGRGCGHCP
jgi:hypothetical protein